MKMRCFPPIRLLLGALTGFLAFSAASYWMQWTSTRAQANALIQPFVAAMKSQDDLAALDWAKSLEGMEQVQAFQILKGPRVIAQGGNQALLAHSPNCGPYLRLPSTYYYNLQFHPVPQEELTGSFLIKAPWGPLSGGLVGALILFIAAWTFHPKLKDRPSTQDSQPGVPPMLIHTPRTDDWVIHTLIESLPGALLLIDERWNIRFISREGLGLFGLASLPDTPVHLMDWNPRPQLVQQLESGKPGICPGGFTHFPQWLIEVKPIPSGGWTLRLTETPDS